MRYKGKTESADRNGIEHRVAVAYGKCRRILFVQDESSILDSLVVFEFIEQPFEIGFTRQCIILFGTELLRPGRV